MNLLENSAQYEAEKVDVLARHLAMISRALIECDPQEIRKNSTIFALSASIIVESLITAGVLTEESFRSKHA